LSENHADEKRTFWNQSDQECLDRISIYQLDFSFLLFWSSH
jgi:hypothetical protein